MDRPLVHLKVIIASLELNLKSIPVRVSSVGFGPIVIIRLYSAQLELELG